MYYTINENDREEFEEFKSSVEELLSKNGMIILMFNLAKELSKIENKEINLLDLSS